MFRVFLLSVLLLSDLALCAASCRPSMEDAGSPQVGNTMTHVRELEKAERLIKDGKQIEATPSSLDLVAQVLQDLPKGGLEKAALPCRMIMLGASAKKESQEALEANIQKLDLSELATLAAVTARNANILKACVKKLEDLGEERKLKTVASWLPNYLSNMKSKLTSCKKLAQFTRNAHKTKVANNTNDEVGQGASSPYEPRLWQMNYLMVRKLIQRVQSYGLASPNDWDDIAGGSELKKFFIEDASLHLDFLLLQHTVLERVKSDRKQFNLTIAVHTVSELLRTLQENLETVRAACKSWGIPDAETRATPYNFKNETIVYGDYTLVFKDGAVHTTRYQDRPLVRVAEAPEQDAEAKNKNWTKQQRQPLPETSLSDCKSLHSQSSDLFELAKLATTCGSNLLAEGPEPESKKRKSTNALILNEEKQKKSGRTK